MKSSILQDNNNIYCSSSPTSLSPRSLLLRILTILILGSLIFYFSFVYEREEVIKGPAVENAIVPTPFANPPSWTFAPFNPLDHVPPRDGFRIGIMALIKREHNYLSDWIKYHLAMGFDRITLYDNEELPTYAELLRNEGLACCVTEANMFEKLPRHIREDTSPATRIIVKHYPFKAVKKTGKNQQDGAIAEFEKYHLFVDKYTHITHIDVDEWFQLNKHNNIRQLVNHTLTDPFGIHPSCAAISLNWIMFGNNNLTHYGPEPVPIRFTCRKKTHLEFDKFLGRVDRMRGFWVHYMKPKPGYRTCTVHNYTVISPPNHRNHSLDYVQLNHYGTRSWQEMVYVRSRGLSVSGKLGKAFPLSKIKARFIQFNFNEEKDYRARNYFLKHVWRLSDQEVKDYPEYPGSQCPTNLGPPDDV